MNPVSEVVRSHGPHQFNVTSNGAKDFNKVFLLLHGYSESGFKIYKRLGHKIDQSREKSLVLAPDGLFPMPKAFPLDTKIAKTKEELLQGYAWYFYHAATDQFLIDYVVPAQCLANWIEKLLKENGLSSSDLVIIGYSQGGYLAPFLGEALTEMGLPPQKVIGLNCSFRADRLKETPSFPLYQIQGKEDTIIDTQLAFDRFQKLKDSGLKEGEFLWLEGCDHKLMPSLSDLCLKIASDSQ